MTATWKVTANWEAVEKTQPADLGTKKPGNQWTREARDGEARDQMTEGPEDQGTRKRRDRGPRDQRTKGPGTRQRQGVRGGG